MYTGGCGARHGVDAKLSGRPGLTSSLTSSSLLRRTLGPQGSAWELAQVPSVGLLTPTEGDWITYFFCLFKATFCLRGAHWHMPSCTLASPMRKGRVGTIAVLLLQASLLAWPGTA